ncbi:heat shock 70 kDa protein 12A-like [Saccostrea echinata]|uniref:heat shock 70 kDa protein 12A-like n=1 Tax=Saccostrea echinata TaxID=191078 RepID=UPI002A83FEB5|nr:heat shock 70 kDa protein 12A-like [Saccostrea echinata]
MGNKQGKEEDGPSKKSSSDEKTKGATGESIPSRKRLPVSESTEESIPGVTGRRTKRHSNSDVTKSSAAKGRSTMPQQTTHVISPSAVWKNEGAEVVELTIKHDRLVVAAIDFGTYGSGFALCTRSDYKKDRNKIFVHTWNSGTAITNKAPTTVLIKPNGRDYVSFGYEAERDFVDMDPSEQKKHYLFRQFKMKLFNNAELSESTKLKDITDKELPAVDVFAAVMRFFRESLQKRLDTKSTEDFSYDDVYWVVTVPAIWDLRAKQFMRKAAEKAGLKDSQLSLALEPEAASMYCRKVPVEISTQRDGAKQIASLPTGSKYLVLDLGGGTIDITAHEVTSDGGLKELHQASGGYYGGTCVNEEIMKFFIRLFGGPVIMRLKEENPGDYLDLMNDIEMKKCTFSPKMNKEKITLRLPVTLLTAYREDTECEIEESLENTTFADDVHIKRDKMTISKKLFHTFFKNSVDNVVRIIKEILDTPGMSDVNTLLAVGGYAESPLMTETLKTVFAHKKVVIPTDPSLAVLKGAVIYGFEPEIIASRVCRYTYGIAKQGIWQEGDPESKKLPQTTRKGLHWCDDVFDKHVEVGQVVKVGEFQEPKDYFAVEGQELALLDFYASTQKNPRFVDEPGCTCVGSFVLDLSGKNSRENILVRIGVGGTELEVEAKEEKTGRVFKSYCNFLP